MIWKYLTKRQLQDGIGDGNLQRLEKMIPLLLEPDHDSDELYTREILVKLYNAFAQADQLKDKRFRKALLNQIPPQELKKLCAQTGTGTKKPTFGERVECLVSKGWGDREFCSKFLDWAQLPTHFLPPKWEMLPEEELLQLPAAPFKVLKDYQFQAYVGALAELDIRLSRFVVQMPTGSGKTRVAMEAISQFINREAADCVVVWLAHSQELCEQSLQCFKEVWCHVATRKLRLYRCWGDGASLPHGFTGSAFIVAGFQKLYSILKKNPMPFQELRDRIKLVIVDEAHKAIAPTYKKVTKALIGSETHVIGLTATPGRSSDNIKENKELSDFFFKRIITIQAPPKRSVITWLRGKKVLSNLAFEPLYTHRTYKLTVKQKEHLERLFDFPKGFLDKIGSDDARNLEIVKRLVKECMSARSTLFFACSVEQSKFICSLLLYLGVHAAHVDGSTDRSLRKKLVDDFKAKNIAVLCNYGVLSTGFDAPKTDVVFISRPTASLVLYSQMLGRGSRGPELGGTAVCKVIDVRDNIIGYPDQDSLYHYFEDYWTT